MENTHTLSKRSRHLLEGASRHLCFAERALIRLSVDEYQVLTDFCRTITAPFDLSERVSDAEYLGKAIIVYLAERSQPCPTIP